MTYERQDPETIIALQAARIAALEKQLREALAGSAKGISGGNEAAAGGSGSRLVGEDEQPPRSSTPTTPAETSALPTPEEIERDYIAARSLGISVEAYQGADALLPPPSRKPLRKLALVRRLSAADCFKAATDDGREPKGAA